LRGGVRAKKTGCSPQGRFLRAFSFLKRRCSMGRYGIVAALFIVIGFLFTDQPFAAEEEETEMPEVVVTATRYLEEERQVPYNVTVITEEDIKNSNAQNVADALRTVPGVTVENSMANPKGSQVDIRGFGESAPNNVLVLVDGRRITEIDLSGTDWSQIPIDQVERIEVIQGGGSVLYGDNAVGGVVNIITKKGEGKPSIQAEADGGSYGSNIQRVLSSGSLDDFSYEVHARHENTDGFRDNGYYDGQDYGGSVGHNIGDIVKLNISGNYHYDKYGMPGPAPDMATWADMKSTNTPNDHAWTQDYFIRLNGEVDLKAWGSLIMDASYRDRKDEADWVSYSLTYKYDIPTIGVTPRWVWEKDIMAFHNKLIAGFDYYHSDSKIEDYSPTMGDPTQNFLEDDTHIRRDSWALYFHDDFFILKNLIFSFGYRYENVKNDFEGSSYSFWIPSWTSFTNEKVDNMHAWDVGLTYLFLENSKAYVRISTSYRIPAIDEYFSAYTGLNTLLVPQEGITYEVGVDHYFTRTIRAGLTFYWMDLDHEIYYNPLTYTNENYDTTRRWGVQLPVEAKPWQWLKLWANYTYTKAIFTGGPFNGNDVPDVPNHKVSFGFDLTPDFVAFLEGLKFNVWVTYYSQRRFISDQPNVVPEMNDYITVNAKLSYSWKFLTAFVGVNNIFNQKYAEYGVCNPLTGERYYYPSPGVNFLAGLSVKF
jgi:iron complex outermembrane receptor protein